MAVIRIAVQAEDQFTRQKVVNQVRLWSENRVDPPLFEIDIIDAGDLDPTVLASRGYTILRVASVHSGENILVNDPDSPELLETEVDRLLARIILGYQE